MNIVVFSKKKTYTSKQMQIENILLNNYIFGTSIDKKKQRKDFFKIIFYKNYNQCDKIWEINNIKRGLNDKV
jgi:hypothetical protein